MEQNKTYSLFWNGPYSQWDPCEFHIGTLAFGCAEQAMMFFKAITFKDYDTAQKIMIALNPSEQKHLGRKVKNFDADLWTNLSFSIVYVINSCKFGQNKDLREYITSDENDCIVEASPYDRIWGIGLGAEDPRALNESKWRGENRLGNVLNDVRKYLRNPLDKKVNTDHNKHWNVVESLIVDNSKFISKIEVLE